MITAEVILDSVSPAGVRLTTFKLRYPKFIHGELMTHRVFSRNASSSRAIPVTKNFTEASEFNLQATPVYWGAEQRGMQSGGELDVKTATVAREVWRRAAIAATAHAKSLAELGVHKSIVNRVMEPFLHINVIVTATEFDNFFGLRLAADAQEHEALLELYIRRARMAIINLGGRPADFDTRKTE